MSRKRTRERDGKDVFSDVRNDEPPYKKFRSENYINGKLSNSPFFGLPLELRQLIFNFLPLRNLLTAQLVCQSWQKECWNCRLSLDFVSDPICQCVTDEFIDYILKLCTRPKWVELYLTDCHSITDNALINLTKAQNLQVISLQECKITERGLHYLTALPKLEQLKLHGRQATVPPEYLSYLGNLTNLQVLALDKLDTDTTDEHLQFFSKLTRLFWISVESPSITGEVFKYMSGLSELNYLDVGFCGIRNENLQYLSHLTTIYSLSLSKNKAIDDEGTKFLTNLHNLGRLDISMCSNMGNVTFLSHMTNLRKLKREFVPSRARDFPEMSILSSMSLLLEFHDFREENGQLNLTPLTKLTALSKLKIQLPELEVPIENDLRQLSLLTQLRSLELDFPPTPQPESVLVFDSFWESLNDATQLKKMTLTNEFRSYGNMQKTLQNLTHLRKLLLK